MTAVVLFGSALAQPVGAASIAAVNEEKGHAFLVDYRGNCYAIMPNHTATSDRVSLVTALPQVAGIATVFARWADEDVALAYVEGEISNRCTIEWSSLSRNVGEVLLQEGAGSLNRINFGGQFLDRTEAHVFDADGTHFAIARTENWSGGPIESSVSGALFFKNALPIGMALEAPDTRTGRFIRTDRIYALAAPVLSGNAAAHPARASVAPSDSGLGYRVTGQVVERDGLRQGIVGANQWDWTGAPMEIELTLSNVEPVALTEIALITDMAGSDAVTPPQRIKIELDVGRPGQPYFRTLFAPDVPPNGVLTIGTGNTRARRIKLRIESVWFPDRPLRIDRIDLR